MLSPTTKSLPLNDPSAEAGICIALWREPENAIQAMLEAGIESRHFQSAVYRAFVEATLSTWLSGKGVSPLSIIGRLLEKAAIPVEEVFKLQDVVSGDTVVYLPDHMERVKRYALTREANSVVNSYLSSVEKDPTGSPAALSALTARLSGILAGKQAEDPRPTNQLKRWSLMPDTGISTGLKRLDEALSTGLVPGRTVMFGAPTGEGKTALACFLTAEAIRQEAPVLYLSTEMRSGPILHRILANLATFDNPNNMLITGEHIANFAKIMETKDQREWNDEEVSIQCCIEATEKYLRIYDTVLSVPDMISRIRLHRTEFGHLPLVIIDHLHRVQPPKEAKAYNKTQELYADIVYSLDSAIMENNTCLVMFSQLSTATEREFRTTNKITSLAFKEAGEISNVASSAFVFGKHQSKALTAVFLLEKDRIKGRKMHIEFSFDPDSFTYSEPLNPNSVNNSPVEEPKVDSEQLSFEIGGDVF